MKEIRFDILEHIGVLSEKSSGWKKELNLVSWNDMPAKYDIREWDEAHKKMGKGITLTKEEILMLSKLVQEKSDD